MNPARAVRLLVLKEARALLPIWLASAAAIVVGMADRRGPLFPFGLLAFSVGAAALGAFSVGHEYAYRTLPALLAQPLPRQRFLLAKAAALAPLLASLAALARLMLVRANGGSPSGRAISSEWLEINTILVPILGFCVAPWLTLIFRHVIAGVVFTLAIPAAVWLAINLVPALDGVVIDFDDVRALSIFWIMILGASAFALVDGPRRFVRLEAADGAGGVSVSRTSRRNAPSAASPGRRHPLAQLVAKEIRLQRVTFLLPAFYILSWAVIVATDSTSFLGPAFFAMTVAYCAVTALLVGALASAEERSLGTLAAQVLQPLAMWKQWTVKVSCALALTLVFTVVLPRALEWVHPLSQQVPVSWGMAGVFLLLATCSLYLSSVSNDGLRALLLAMPFAAVAGPLFVTITEETQKAIWRPITPVLQTLSLNWTRPIPLLSGADSDWYRWSERWLQVAVLCVLVALLIWMAARNHRSAEHGLGRMRRQLLWLVPCVVMGGVISGAVPPLLLWFLGTH
ncbi:MAG TPA: hypothetical protein VFO58_15415 [Vicinamibacterales bacterium]|nr:hypothetical protein [Vicinamibacterales bacterium]